MCGQVFTSRKSWQQGVRRLPCAYEASICIQNRIRQIVCENIITDIMYKHEELPTLITCTQGLEKH